MRLHHSVAQESIGLLRHSIEQVAGVTNAAVWVGGREGGDEFGDEIEVCMEGVHEHEGVDLEEGGCEVAFQFEEREALRLSWAPQPRQMQS